MSIYLDICVQTTEDWRDCIIAVFLWGRMIGVLIVIMLLGTPLVDTIAW